MNNPNSTSTPTSEQLLAYNDFIAIHTNSVILNMKQSLECSPIADIYVRCSDIVWADPLLGKRVAQFEIKQFILGACPFTNTGDTEPTEALGLLKNASIKLEVRLPDFLFSGQFGYSQMQTNIAKLASDAINFAAGKVEVLMDCQNYVSARFEFRKNFFDFIKDPDVIAQYFSNPSQVEIFQNYQTSPANYTPVEAPPSFFESVTNCN